MPSRSAWRCASASSPGGRTSRPSSRSTQAVQAAMAHTPLFPYSVEVVTDNALPYMAQRQDDPGAQALPDRDAGPLQGACPALRAGGRRPSRTRTWLFHLDEETHITPSVIRGHPQCGRRRGAFGRAAHRPGRGAVPPRPVRAPLPHPGRLGPHRRRPGPVPPAAPCSARAPSACTGRSSWSATTSRWTWGSTSARPGRSPRTRGGRWWRWRRDAGRAGWTGTAWSSPPSRSWTSSSSGGAGSSGSAWSASTRPPASGTGSPWCRPSSCGGRLAGLVERQHRRPHRQRPHPLDGPPHRDGVARRLLRPLPSRL